MIIKLLANSQDTRTMQGTHFRVTDSSRPVKVTFEKTGLSSQTVTLEKGMAFEPRGGFEKVTLLSEYAQTLNIEVTNGTLSDNRLTGTVDVNLRSLNEIQSRRIVGIVAVRVVIAQQNTSRASIIIKNVGNQVAYIGGIDVESQGFKLAENESLKIERAAAAEIYAVSTVTGTDLHVFEEFDQSQGVTIPGDILKTESGGSLLTESGEYLTA